MEWSSWSQFWDMGGYGFYVWSSYAAMLLGIVIEVVLLRRGRQDTLRRLRRLERWEQSPGERPS